MKAILIACSWLAKFYGVTNKSVPKQNHNRNHQRTRWAGRDSIPEYQERKKEGELQRRATRKFGIVIKLEIVWGESLAKHTSSSLPLLAAASAANTSSRDGDGQLRREKKE